MSTATVEQLDIRYIPLAEIHESPLNTRTHFDPVKLQELADSMKTSAQLTPALVRPSKLEGKPGFELASGHRRRRAAEMAGLPELMAIVRDLDDATFLEILTVDNLQREDVHPLEEAQGYKNLLMLDGYSAKRIAERVGKTESYVYDRLRLLQLIPDAKELFFANRFSVGHATLIARIPASAQEKLINPSMYADGLWRRDFGHATLDLPRPDAEEGKHAGLRPVSVRELQAWIDDNVRFNAVDESVPQLFPETAVTLAEAQQQGEKVVEITRNHHVDPVAKDPAGGRTYSPSAWKRADGSEPGAETCDHSVIGLVAVGEGRGESFRVCVDKKRCMVHWGDEIRERNKRERAKADAPAAPAASTSARKEDPWERDRRLRAEREARAKARWAKGGEAVLRAVAVEVRKLTVGANGAAADYFLGLLEDGLNGLRDLGKQAAKLGVARGSTPSDLMRHVIMIALIDRGEPGYNGTNEQDLQEDLKALKIKVDVVKLLDAANPEPKKDEAKAPAKKTAAKKAVAKPAKKAKRG